MSYKTEFQSNNADLQAILDTVNSLPEAGSGEPVVEEMTNSAGGKSVYINSEVPKLPEGFTRLKWIQSTGSQYVDTGVYLTSNSRVVCDFQHVGLDDYNCLFGSRDGAANVNSFAFWTAAQQYLEGYYGSERFAFPDSFSLTDRYTIDWNASNITMGGTALSVTPTSFTASYPALLFAINQGGTPSYKAKAKMWGTKMYTNGVLVRDYVPCLNASGVAGLYDMVNGVFYGDAAGGAFVAGPVVLEYELPEGYEELEWIQSDGRQYADTGVLVNNNTRLIADAQFLAGSSSGHIASTTDGTRFWTLYLDTNAIGSRYGTSAAILFAKNAPVWSDRNVYDKNGATTTIGQYSVTSAAATFSISYPLTLFARNNSGTKDYYASMTLYSCQIYDNGTLVRYYVPCRTNTGEVGLWDAVNNTFTGDAAGVGFLAGPSKGVSKVVLEDRTLIDLTQDTVTPEALLSGFTAHDAMGQLIQGAASAGTPMAYGYLTTNGASAFTISGLPFRPVGIVFSCNLNGATGSGTGNNRTLCGNYVLGDSSLVYLIASTMGGLKFETGVTITDSSIAVPFAYGIPDKIFYVVWGAA